MDGINGRLNSFISIEIDPIFYTVGTVVSFVNNENPTSSRFDTAALGAKPCCTTNIDSSWFVTNKV